MPLVLPGGTGYLRDPDKLAGESPDWSASELLADEEPPDSVDSRRHVLSILHQGHAPKCVGAATGQMLRCELSAQGVADPELPSPTWIWTLARMQHDALRQYSGTHIRMAFQAIAKHGFAPVSAWPDDEELIKGKPRWQRPPSAAAVRLAYDQRARIGVDYYRIDSFGDSRVRDIKRAVAQGHFPVFGTLVGDELGRVHDMMPLRPPSLTSDLGGHAMMVCGYDRESALICNSWGYRFGVDGFCRFSWEYMIWAMTWDIWVARAVPNYSTEIAA